jgi:hypothetical protein
MLQIPCGGIEILQQQNLTKKTEKGMVGPQVIAAYQNHFVGIGHGTSP